VNAAIQNAFNNDIIMCAATGNTNMNNIDYPARNPQVIACGASDQIDNHVWKEFCKCRPWNCIRHCGYVCRERTRKAGFKISVMS